MTLFVSEEHITPDPDESKGCQVEVVDVSDENSHSFVSELNDLSHNEVNHPDESSVEHELDPSIVVLASWAVVDKLSAGNQEQKSDNELSGLYCLEFTSWLDIVGVWVKHLCMLLMNYKGN